MNFMNKVCLKRVSMSPLLLIPKKEKNSTIEIKHFFPISLLSRIYEILSKVLANRLSMVVEKLISKPQTAFVRDLQILDLVLIANEFLDCKLKLGVSGLVQA